jgi:hypothetical protein
MYVVVKWYAFRLLLVSILALVGCASEGLKLDAPFVPGSGPGVLYDAGIDLGVDAISILPDGSFDVVTGAPDSRPVAVDTAPGGLDVVAAALDTKPVAPDTGLDTGPDVVPALPDTTPAIPCDKFGPLAGAPNYPTMPIALPTTAYCFKLCSSSFPLIDPLSYSWACLGFTDADRMITVNGQAMSCKITSSGSASVLPEVVDGAWTFTISAGPAAYIQWAGGLRVCP